MSWATARERLLSCLWWPFRVVQRFYRSRQRAIDLQILWPAFKRESPTLDDARTGFIIHMGMDDAWKGMSDEELVEFVRTKLV
jgi:hypothetical protein